MRAAIGSRPFDEDTALGLAAAGPGPFGSTLALIGAGEAGLDAARAALRAAPAEARWRVPLTPVQHRDGLMFEEHLLNSFAAAGRMTGRSYEIPQVWYEQPIDYKGERLSFVGHEEDVIWPACAEVLDIELELAAVIGRRGRDIRPADAPAHIFGHAVLDEVSARDAQMHEMPGQLGPAEGKDFDTGNALGPVILTADEIEHPAALAIEARVNAERRGGGNSRDTHHDFGAILAHVSASQTLHPGEVIGSGTVGTGCGLETGRRLSPGDRMELTIEGIGTLANTTRRDA